jgi:hypothetical protein
MAETAKIEYEMNRIQFNCAVGIIFDLMRKGYLTTAEYDMVSARLKERYGLEQGCAE